MNINTVNEEPSTVFTRLDSSTILDRNVNDLLNIESEQVTQVNPSMQFTLAADGDQITIGNSPQFLNTGSEYPAPNFSMGASDHHLDFNIANSVVELVSSDICPASNNDDYPLMDGSDVFHQDAVMGISISFDDIGLRDLGNFDGIPYQDNPEKAFGSHLQDFMFDDGSNNLFFNLEFHDLLHPVTGEMAESTCGIDDLVFSGSENFIMADGSDFVSPDTDYWFNDGNADSWGMDNVTTCNQILDFASYHNEQIDLSALLASLEPTDHHLDFSSVYDQNLSLDSNTSDDSNAILPLDASIADTSDLATMSVLDSLLADNTNDHYLNSIV